MESNNNHIDGQEWYASLLDDCGAAIGEGIYQSKWILVKTYHLVGQRILEEAKRFEEAGVKNLASRVAKDLDRSTRTIERAIQFARTYPDIDQVPGGKNISWHVICNELLPTPTDKEKKEIELEASQCQHKAMCVKCKKMLTY